MKKISLNDIEANIQYDYYDTAKSWQPWPNTISFKCHDYPLNGMEYMIYVSGWSE